MKIARASSVSAGFLARLAERRCRTSALTGRKCRRRFARSNALDRQSLQLQTFTNAECGFGYRTSIFNTTERDRYIILRVSFALRRGGKPAIRYADLQKAFGGLRQSPTLLQVRDAVREIRRSKAMLIVPGDDDCRSAGSFFKNPIVPQQPVRRTRRRGCVRAAWLCPAIPQAKASANSPLPGW